jgi:ferritin-like metal-binding protein YciE
MDAETARRSAGREGTNQRTRGGTRRNKPSGRAGSVTKGSAGRPKASGPNAPKGHTREHQTTSTNLPNTPVPKDFLNKLGEMHTAERELTRALPLVAKAAKSKDLKTLLQIHLKETKGQVKALEQIAQSLGEELPSRSCKPMTRLINEGVKVIGKRLVSSDQDEALIGVGQKIERFEINAYAPLCATAQQNESTHELALLTSILNQEKLANELLGALAAGKGPLNKLVQQASLRHVKAAA